MSENEPKTPTEEAAELRDQLDTLKAERVQPALAQVAGKAEEYTAQAKQVVTGQAEMLSDQIRKAPFLTILLAAGAGYVLGRAIR